MDSDTNRSGAKIGSYQLVRRIGVGGMGTVYEAEHVHLRARWAIKILRQDLESDQTAKRRFLQEARLAAGLRHPNVVDVRDVGETPEGLVYIVMELLEGRDLAIHLEQRGPLAWTEAKRIVSQLASALTVAHEKGLIHRDIKPSNCFLATHPQGEPVVKLLDFGIAKPLQHNDPQFSQLTSRGGLLGTAAFMAPELAQGYSASFQSDIYSAGVMLFQILTGKLPFTGKTAFQILTQHVRIPPPRPSSLAASIPPAVDSLVLRMLEKEPQDRFASAPALLAAIEEIASEAAVPSGSATADVPPTTSTSISTAAIRAFVQQSSHDALEATIWVPKSFVRAVGDEPTASFCEEPLDIFDVLGVPAEGHEAVPVLERTERLPAPALPEPRSHDHVPAELRARYRVETFIGEGRTGLVYRAFDTVSRRAVCLKVLRPELAEHPSVRSHFMLEGHASMKLDHRHIATVYEVIDTSQPVIVSQYASRGTLRERFQEESSCSWATIKQRMLGILSGLAQAHSQSVVHGDIKPSNCGITLDDDSGQKIVLLDFSDLLFVGQRYLVGTPSYMAPERIDGVRDWRSDIYSAGVLMFEMITGRRPFEGRSASQDLHSHRFETPPQVSAFVPYFPASIEVIVQSAMHKSVHSRIQSAAAFAAALRAVPVGDETHWDRRPSPASSDDVISRTVPMRALGSPPAPRWPPTDAAARGEASLEAHEPDGAPEAKVLDDQWSSSLGIGHGSTTILDQIWARLSPKERHKLSAFSKNRQEPETLCAPGDVRVFVSFSHDVEAHVQQVRAFTQALRDAGFSVFCDLDSQRPARDWPDLVGRELLVADYICCVCTYAYRSHFEGESPTGRGRGVAYEGALIRQEVVLQAGHRARFLPVLFEAAHPSCIPGVLGEGTSIYFRWPANGAELLEQLRRPTTRRKLTMFITKMFEAPDELKRALDPVLPGMIHDPSENIYRLAAKVTHILLSEDRRMQQRIMAALLDESRSSDDVTQSEKHRLVDIVTSLQLFDLFGKP